MCLIIHKPKTCSVPSEIIDNVVLYQNPDRLSIFYHDTREIITRMDVDDAAALLEIQRPYTAHFRFAASGSASTGTCLPLPIDSNYALMMGCAINRLGCKDVVDPQQLCQVLAGLPVRTMVGILQSYDCRSALLHLKSGRVSIIHRDLWPKRQGVLYSKADCFPIAKPKRSCSEKGYIGYGATTNLTRCD